MEIIPKQFQTFEHPMIDTETESSVLNQLHTNISLYDNGGIYKEIEDGLKHLFPTKHILTVSNGTSALLSMFFGAGITEGDEVIVPAYTFFATATPLFLLGAMPVLADCKSDGNMDPEAAELLITDKTKAVVVTHMWGIPCDMPRLAQIAQKHKILLLEDCSHAHGATLNGEIVGTHWSDAAAWSLQGKKLLTSGEGGFIATNNTSIFERAVLLGHFNKRAKLDVTDPTLTPFAITGVGGNLRMHPLGAAVLRPQLKRFPTMLKERRECAAALTKAILEIPGLSPVELAETADPAWYAYPFMFDSDQFNCDAKTFLKTIIEAGAVEADMPGSTCPLNRYALFTEPWKFYPRYEQHKKMAAHNSQTFPEAAKFHANMIKLPTWYGPDREKYTNYYISAIKQAAEIHRK